MYCRHCGTKLPDDARFCAACGLRSVPGPQDQASMAPRIQYSDYWKAVRQFGLGMKWYVCQAALYALFVPISIRNFGIAIDNLGGVHDAYYILAAILSIAITVFYVGGILANLRFKKRLSSTCMQNWSLAYSRACLCLS